MEMGKRTVLIAAWMLLDVRSGVVAFCDDYLINCRVKVISRLCICVCVEGSL